MAYDHTQYVASLGNDVVCTSTGEKGDWSPGYLPHIVRALSVGVTVASATTTDTVVTFYRNTLGTTTTTNRTTIDTITVPAAAAAGNVYYVDENTTNFTQYEISPGQELQATVTTASTTTGTVMIDAVVEPRWEVPGNDTNLTESA
jgi:hypothetical protein